MKTKFLALIVCTLPLTALLGFCRFIESGNLERVAYDVPVTITVPTTLEEVRAFLDKGIRAEKTIVPFMALAFAILLILDANALFVRNPSRVGQVRQPADDPMGYAMLRLRRHAFIPLAVTWAFTYCYCTGVSPHTPVVIVTAVAFILARRGENETYGSMYEQAVKFTSEFCKGFSQGH